MMDFFQATNNSKYAGDVGDSNDILRFAVEKRLEVFKGYL
jgi:hypothetical protein